MRCPITLRDSEVSVDTGFALGQLWMKRPSWTIARHLRTSDSDSSERRPGFPTWSWASLDAEIYQDNYGTQSAYGRYISGLRVEFPRNESELKVHVSQGGGMLQLSEAVKSKDRLALSTSNPRLRIEGDLVRLRYVMKDATNDRWFYLFGQWRFFEPDGPRTVKHFPGQPSLEDFANDSEAWVLVLLQWNESQRPDKKRFLLMVLHWLASDHAERLGLLTEYRDEFSASDIDELPRVRQEFYLV